MTRAAAALGVLVLWWVAAAASDTGARGYEEARARYGALLQEDAATGQASAWRDTAAAFREVATSPSALADDALYLSGLCLERAFGLSGEAADQNGAVQAYDDLSEAHAGSNLADDALLRAGRILEFRGDAAGARGYYERLLARHRGGDMAPAARRRLARLGRRASVQGVHSYSGPRYTRVVIDLAAALPFQVRTLPPDPAAGRGDRIYVDVANARLAAACAPCAAVGDGVVRQVRAGQHDPRTVRVVLDLEAPAGFRAFPLDAPARLVVDVFRSASSPDPVAELLPPAGEAAAPPRLRIVIDPGHGGRDPGAIGLGGIREKDVTLSIAREVAALLREEGGWDVKLTREGDQTLALEQRTAIANAFGADLFVSIHANASPSRRAEGVETYYLERASDRAARTLAARENGGGHVEEMEHILADVVLTSKVRESRRLAEKLQRALVGRLEREGKAPKDLGVKRGPFYVLTGAFMPAALVETAFLTHPEEGRLLADSGFRREAAEAIAAGIGTFREGT